MNEELQIKIKQIANDLGWSYFSIDTRYYKGELVEIAINKED